MYLFITIKWPVVTQKLDKLLYNFLLKNAIRMVSKIENTVSEFVQRSVHQKHLMRMGRSNAPTPGTYIAKIRRGKEQKMQPRT